MNLTELFQVEGKALPLPDAGVEFSYEDIDSADAGRDQSGVMHRQMVRCKVGKWTFRYDYLTEQQRQYLEAVFPDTATFRFTHPDRQDATKSVTTRCYRSRVSMSWYNAKMGLWRNYSFSVIAC